ncbi:hypothetical protein OIO90_001351 [Microbotryomycetes sp. JL221]|nr:hypothetical protein OIO90_001351 [Microbotryomycetes sp. JL221]
MERDLNQPIVIDQGSGTLKAGFAGSDHPSTYFPSYVGRPKHTKVMAGAVEGDTFVGKKAQELRGLLRINYPMSHGIVTDWDDMERIWSHVYSEELRTLSEEHPVLLTEAPLNPRTNREQAAQIFFETFNVPAMYTSVQAILALYASGRTTGIVLDSGDGVTHAVPVFEGFSMPHAIRRIDIAGRDVTDHLQLLLRKSGYHLHTSAEKEVVRTIKEKTCYIALSPAKEEKEAQGRTDEFKLPDGNVIRLGTERFRAPELLFNPEIIGTEYSGIHQVVVDSINCADLDLRKSLFGNIVLSGGGTLVKGFGDRLLHEVKRLALRDTKIRISAPPERKYSTWIGGSILAGLSTFKKMWVSAEEYQEAQLAICSQEPKSSKIRGGRKIETTRPSVPIEGIPSGSSSSLEDVVSSSVPHPSEDHRPPAIPSTIGNFSLIEEHQVSFAPITVAKWRSRETGLSVVWSNAPGPLISAWITVVTEIFDDSGRPHTLEHLTFMGSQNYPYKGFLDKACNRCAADGTNAWTAVDNTTYTTATASEEGMLNLLPMFLDHIFQPTLTDAAFITEIYHIDGNGKEGGVTFSEMQGSAGSSWELLEREMQQTLYSKQNAYRSETGGMLDALRELKLKDIRAFHHLMYVPQNVTINIMGQAMRPEQLLHTIQTKVEPMLDKIGLARGINPPGWRRPFVESSTAVNPPHLTSNILKVVEYPEQDESVGEISIHWVGPTVDMLSFSAWSLLSDYLSTSSVSPLVQQFVENDDPCCSSIGLDVRFLSPIMLNLVAHSVPKAKLNNLASQVMQALVAVVEAGIDMQRMQDVIRQTRSSALLRAESSPREWLAASISTNTLWGREGSLSLGDALEDIQWLTILSKWSSSQWCKLIKDWLISAHSLVVIGKPSPELARRQVREDKMRVATALKSMGPQGAAAQARLLRQAELQNSRPIPADLLEKIKIPDLSTIDWFDVESARAKGVSSCDNPFSGRVQDHVNQDVGCPYFIQFDHVRSEFVEIRIILHAPPPAHELLRLYIDVALSLPVKRNGIVLSYEEATEQVERDLLWRTVGTVGEGMSFTTLCERSKYAKAVAWMKDIIFGSIFEVKRLINTVKTTIADLPAEREDDAGLAAAAQQELICVKDSVLHQTGIMNVVREWPKLLKRLKNDPTSVVRDLENLRHEMTDPRAIRISVVGDILKLEKPSSTWLENFVPIKPFKASPFRSELQPLFFLIIESAAGKSSYSRHMTAGPSYQDPDFAALKVALSILNATEGLLWTSVRGKGLAYGASIVHSAETETITFIVFKSPDAYQAFEAARQCIEQVVARKILITQGMVDSAKSTLAFDAVRSESTIKEAAVASFEDTVLHDRPRHFSRWLLNKIETVKLCEVVPVIQHWISPIFEAAHSIGAASVGGATLPSLVDGFTRRGYQVQVKRI